MRIISKIKSAAQLVKSLGDLWLMIRIAGFIFSLPLLLRGLKLPRLMSWLTPGRPGRYSLELREKITAYTLTLLNQDLWMFRRSCLKQGLTLYHFLPQAGQRVQIAFGVEKSADNVLNGHCWLEIAGQVYLEGEAAREKYTLTYRYPEPSPNPLTPEFVPSR